MDVYICHDEYKPVIANVKDEDDDDKINAMLLLTHDYSYYLMIVFMISLG